MDEGDKWVTIVEAAKLSGYSEHYIRQMLNKGRLAGRKFGPIWQVDRAALEAYVTKATEKGATDKRFGPDA